MNRMPQGNVLLRVGVIMMVFSVTLAVGFAAVVVWHNGAQEGEAVSVEPVAAETLWRLGAQGGGGR